MLSKFRDDVKDLKSIWIKNLKLNAAELCTEEERNRYYNQKIELDSEISRRQELGKIYGKLYAKIEDLFGENQEFSRKSFENIAELLDDTVSSIENVSEMMQNNSNEELIFNQRNKAIYNIEKLYDLFDQYHSSCWNRSLTGDYSGCTLAYTVKSKIGLTSYKERYILLMLDIDF